MTCLIVFNGLKFYVTAPSVKTDATIFVLVISGNNGNDVFCCNSFTKFLICFFFIGNILVKTSFNVFLGLRCTDKEVIHLLDICHARLRNNLSWVNIGHFQVAKRTMITLCVVPSNQRKRTTLYGSGSFLHIVHFRKMKRFYLVFDKFLNGFRLVQVLFMDRCYLWHGD